MSHFNILGKLCVPINADSVENFDPNSVPTLRDLVNNNLETPGMDIFNSFCFNPIP